MVKNIVLSLLFAVILPTITNIVYSKNSNDKIKKDYFDKAFFIRATIIFLISMIISTLSEIEKHVRDLTKNSARSQQNQGQGILYNTLYLLLDRNNVAISTHFFKIMMLCFSLWACDIWLLKYAIRLCLNTQRQSNSLYEMAS